MSLASAEQFSGVAVLLLAAPAIIQSHRNMFWIVGSCQIIIYLFFFYLDNMTFSQIRRFLTSMPFSNSDNSLDKDMKSSFFLKLFQACWMFLSYFFCILSFWILTKFKFLSFYYNLSFFFSFITTLVFDFYHNELLSFITNWVSEFHQNLNSWVSSQFEFLSSITIWVFEFHHNFSSTFITIWVFELYYNLSLWISSTIGV